MLSTHIKARINSESFGVYDVAAAVLETTPMMLKFLHTPETIAFVTGKVDWFPESLQLVLRLQKTSNSWVLLSRQSSEYDIIHRLKKMFPDAIEIATPTETELVSN